MRPRVPNFAASGGAFKTAPIWSLPYTLRSMVVPSKKARYLKRAALVCAVLVLVGVAAVWLYASVDDAFSLPAPSRVAWFDANGDPIPLGEQDFEHCGADYGFESLVFDGGLWASCTTGEPTLDGLVRIDPENGRGQHWPVPDDLPYMGTEGLIPNEDGRLGVVYAAREIGGDVAVAILGREGWVRTAHVVSDAPRTRFVGGAWVNGELELVLYHYETQQYSIVRVADETHVRLPFAESGMPCSEEERCYLSNVAVRREGEWRFLAESSEGLVEINEAGEMQPSPWPREVRGLQMYVDNAVHGVVRSGGYVSLRDDRNLGIVQQDGSLAALTPFPNSGWRAALGQHLVFEAGVLSHWLGGISQDGVFSHWIDGRWAGITQVGLTIEAVRYGEGGEAEGHQPVGELSPDSTCTLFPLYAALMRAQGGGYWFAAGSGCYLPIDENVFAAPSNEEAP